MGLRELNINSVLAADARLGQANALQRQRSDERKAKRRGRALGTVGAIVGGYFGGPQGAAAGYGVGSSLAGGNTQGVVQSGAALAGGIQAGNTAESNAALRTTAAGQFAGTPAVSATEDRFEATTTLTSPLFSDRPGDEIFGSSDPQLKFIPGTPSTPAIASNAKAGFTTLLKDTQLGPGALQNLGRLASQRGGETFTTLTPKQAVAAGFGIGAVVQRSNTTGKLTRVRPSPALRPGRRLRLGDTRDIPLGNGLFRKEQVTGFDAKTGQPLFEIVGKQFRKRAKPVETRKRDKFRILTPEDLKDPKYARLDPSKVHQLNITTSRVNPVGNAKPNEKDGKRFRILTTKEVAANPALIAGTTYQIDTKTNKISKLDRAPEIRAASTVGRITQDFKNNIISEKVFNKALDRALGRDKKSGRFRATVFDKERGQDRLKIFNADGTIFEDIGRAKKGDTSIGDLVGAILEKSQKTGVPPSARDVDLLKLWQRSVGFNAALDEQIQNTLGLKSNFFLNPRGVDRRKTPPPTVKIPDSIKTRAGNVSDADALEQARAAIQRDPTKRDAIIKQLKALKPNVDTSGL